MNIRDSMGIATRLLVLLVLTLMPILANAGTNCGTFVNAGFETGDFSGWDTYNMGASAVIGKFFDTNFVTPKAVLPYEGSKQARLTPAGNSYNPQAIETFLNVPMYYFTEIGWFSRGTAIKQSIHLFQGQQISLAYYWAGHDYLYYNDTAFVTLQEPFQGTKARVFQIASIAQYGDGYAPGRSPATGQGIGSSGYLIWPLGAWAAGPQTWAALSTRTWSYRAPVEGWYTIGIAVFDSGDYQSPPDLLIDRAYCLDPTYKAKAVR